MYIFSPKVKKDRVRNKTARLRAKFRKKNQKRIARMLKP